MRNSINIVIDILINKDTVKRYHDTLTHYIIHNYIKNQMKHRNRGLLQNIQLSIVIMVFGIVLYSSITVIAFGISSTPSSSSQFLISQY